MRFFDKLFGRNRQASKPSLRAVPGALTATNRDGAVIYNMLTPHMQQFMGRCVSAIKKAGIASKGTAQFSILVGERRAELRLDKFYRPEDNPTFVEDVLHAAQKLNTNA